jgi:phosphatidylglycerol:prolipoprotein diacylglycerol transferase
MVRAGTAATEADSTEPTRPDASGATALDAVGSQPACGGFGAEVAATGPLALAATYWLDSGTSGTPYSVLIRFVGTRVGLTGNPAPGDHFDQVERVDGIVPGSGRVAITTRPAGINPGEWQVTATPLQEFDSGPAETIGARLPRRDLTAHTTLSPLVHGPGVRLGMWPGLVGLGVLVGLVIQAVLLAGAHVDVPVAAAISLGASIIGYVSAKTWYLVQYRQHPRTFIQAGACIQGFLVGGIGTMAIAVAAFGLPVGTFLDASTPGLFLGMAIGRPGCFFTGCCVGRPTAYRWGLWCSDRRLGIRRIPIQLVEAATALLIGIATLPLALAAQVPVRGAIFVGALAAYTLVRQLLFPLRAEPRTTSFGRTLTLVGCALVLLTDLAVSAVA